MTVRVAINGFGRDQTGATVEIRIVHADGTPARRSLQLVEQPAKRSAIASDC